MQHVAISLVAAVSVPLFVFCWMMCVAALALLDGGEHPRVVLSMPRTLLRGCGERNAATAQDPASVAGD